MDVKNDPVEDLLLYAIKSEVESRNFYSKLSSKISDPFIKDRLGFLSEEEEGHREFLTRMFENRFPQSRVVLPKDTPVPGFDRQVLKKGVDADAVLDGAIEAELAAHEFYSSLAHRFSDQGGRELLSYLAVIEKGHHALLLVLKNEPWRGKWLGREVFKP